MYTYFIKPRVGPKEVDEEDLDEPTSAQLEQELSKEVPGSRVYSSASKKSEPKGTVRFYFSNFTSVLIKYVLSHVFQYHVYKAFAVEILNFSGPINAFASIGDY